MDNPVSWGADCAISMPETRVAREDDVDLGGGHVFGTYGLVHNFSTSDAEVFFQPVYAPLPSAEGAS